MKSQRTDAAIIPTFTTLSSPRYYQEGYGLLGKRLSGAKKFIDAWFASQFPQELKSKKNGQQKPKVPAFTR